MNVLPVVSQTDNHFPSSVGEFFTQQWQVYRKILQGNFMSHQQFYACLHDFLRQHNSGFQLLELGCGDASLTLQALQETTVTAYVGVDLSSTALELATANFANQSFVSHFFQDDFCQWLTTDPTTYDLILASFSVHHLSLEAKAELFGQIRAHLKPQGKFLLLDVVRRPQEDREAYLQRYLDHMHQDWTGMQPEELDFIARHIKESDFPESLSQLQQMGLEQGFQRVESLYVDSAQTANLICFSC